MRVERHGAGWRAYPIGRPWLSRAFGTWRAAMDYANSVADIEGEDLPIPPFGMAWEVHGAPDRPWLWTNEVIDCEDGEEFEWLAVASGGNGYAFLIDIQL